MAALPTLFRRALAALSLLAAPLLATGCSREMPVTESDKALFVRAADLAPFGAETRDAERYETFRKARAFDGSYELEYEFRTPDGEQESPLFVSVMATVEKNASDARLTQGAHRTGALGMLKWEGMGVRELADLPVMGDASQLHVLENEGSPVGNFFTMRKGERVYTVLVAGVYFDDPEEWNALVAPRLKRFLDYSPGAAADAKTE